MKQKMEFEILSDISIKNKQVFFEIFDKYSHKKQLKYKSWLGKEGKKHSKEFAEREKRYKRRIKELFKIIN